jgi:hypothetical protein
VSGGGTFTPGNSQTVTATANSSYTFVNWAENGGVVSAAASYTFMLTANSTLVANFTAAALLHLDQLVARSKKRLDLMAVDRLHMDARKPARPQHLGQSEVVGATAMPSASLARRRSTLPVRRKSWP